MNAQNPNLPPAENPVAQFVRDCYFPMYGGYNQPNRAAYECYKHWCLTEGQRPLRIQDFRPALAACGVPMHKCREAWQISNGKCVLNANRKRDAFEDEARALLAEYTEKLVAKFEEHYFPNASQLAPDYLPDLHLETQRH